MENSDSHKRLKKASLFWIPSILFQTTHRKLLENTCSIDSA
jgi:hypothetical protein